jgi:hypothetical protein
MMVAATVGWLLFALPCSLAAGNLFSIAMPYRINPGRIARQRGSQANALSSLLVQLGMIAVGVMVFGLCWYVQKPWLAVPVFVALGGGAVYAWLLVLNKVDVMANQRRDALMATLLKDS